MISRLIYDENNKKKERRMGEVNHPDTVKVNNGTNLTSDSFVIGVKGTRNVKILPSARWSLVMTNGAGEVYLEPYHNKANQLVGTDANGNFHFFPRRDYPLTPPTGERLYAEVYGSVYPAADYGAKVMSFTEPGWYDIEVAGAGGGGGGGGMGQSGFLISGARGGNGGRVRHRVLVTAIDGVTSQDVNVPVIKLGTSVNMAAGNSGGGGAGLKAPSAKPSKGNKIVEWNPRGGMGGRSPILFYTKGNAGDNFQGYDVPTRHTLRYGGKGVEGGAEGGSSQFTSGSGSGSAGGGGASGPYGGTGGYSLVSISYSDASGYYSGAGGGAGGGCGTGGRGGFNNKNGQTSTGGVSYGGGGGGDSYSTQIAGKTFTDDDTQSFGGGGGGGGGASYFSCNTVDGQLLLMAGGGGGGAGSASGNGYSMAGQPGQNNVNSDQGGGADGGSGNLSVTGAQIQTNGQAYDLKGNNGQAGWVKVWKRI